MTYLSSPLITGTYDPRHAHAIQSFVPHDGQFFALPVQFAKSYAVECTCTSLRLMDAPEGAIAYYRTLAQSTERSAWHSRYAGVINWRRQCELARDLGITERTARRYEQCLERLGAIARTTTANGYRGHRVGRHTSIAGISLEPSIANFGAYQLLNEEVAKDKDAHRAQIITIQLTERRLRLLQSQLTDPDAIAWCQAHLTTCQDTHRPSALRDGTIEQLSRYHTALLAFEHQLRAAVADALQTPATPTADVSTDIPPHPPQASDHPMDHHQHHTSPSETESADPPLPARHQAADDTPVSMMPTSSNISLAPDSSVRRTGQESPPPIHLKTYQESCNRSASPHTKSHPASDVTSAAKTSQGTKGIAPQSFTALFGQCHGREITGMMSADLMTILADGGYRELASDDALLYLDHFPFWENAIYMILRELNIQPTAWHEACHIMGDAMAAVALLVIDRNRFHPEAPITNPGGALRAFTHCARAGKLNLTQSVMGILSRSRSGLQPRRAPHDDHSLQ